MASSVDLLSDLPDELLLRVLHFVPGKQAAATTALSRRWCLPLWRSSGAVNLETDVEDCGWDDDGPFFSRRDAFVSAAEAALDAANVPVTRLTLRVIGHNSIDMFLNDDRDMKLPRHHGALAKLLSHRAARRVEELRLDAEDSDRRTYGAYSDPDDEIGLSSLGVYVFNLGFVPSENLRLLDLTNCRDLVPPASAVVFALLSTLRLDALQSLIYAAPALVTVHFEEPNSGLPIYHGWDAFSTPPRPPAEALLRLPAATVLALERCIWKNKDGSLRYYIVDNAGVVPAEIDAPKLRRFRYKGVLWPFSLSPPPPDLAHADLHFVPRARNEILRRHKETDEGNLETFWRFLHNFAGAKELKLNVNPLEDMAVLSEERRAELLPVFSILRRLELHGVHRPKGKTAAVAIANLLRCCPTLRDLRINLTAEHHYPHYWHDDENLFLERKFSADRDKSIDLLNRYRNSDPRAVSPEGNNTANYDEVSEIPGLSQHSFDCLGNSLVRVGLQFRLGAANCLGAKLIKFFAENAMVLEEMFIDGGNTKLWEHMMYKVERLISDSSIRRKPGASSYVVLPLRGDLTINNEN